MALEESYNDQIKLLGLGKKPSTQLLVNRRKYMEDHFLSRNKNAGIDGFKTDSITPEIAHELYAKLLDSFSFEIIDAKVKLVKCNKEVQATLKKALIDYMTSKKKKRKKKLETQI